ncbi:MAG: dockerin type I domain-containing protein [Phycisphaerae bacterium]|jgi:hypothetical protein|nr:dockerin type I domain-containing protein [Phycisphaerae bacterium]
MNSSRIVKVCAILLILSAVAVAALVVPSDIELPGTQPGEVSNLESPDKCDNCHGGYNTAVEPAHTWRGSMMANAGRDPIFWATVAIAEQDFDGVGDLCIRCHSTTGWLAGRSTPTDGSGLAAGDDDGVDCDYCHKLTNPDNSEHAGEMNAPYIANDGGNPPDAYYGSGMGSLWGGNQKIGPYSDADAKHKVLSSNFHRSSDLCGTCHDVSNSAVGDLAHNNGAQTPLAQGTFSGQLGGAVANKAAFNNFPFMYGVVERTFSEHKASLLAQTPVSSYHQLPVELQAGAIRASYESSIIAGASGDYEDGATRLFTCQTCHMRPVTGRGCNKNPPVRKDLPMHDLTGGNYWMPDVIKYLDARNELRLGGGLTSDQIAALDDGKLRAQKQLSQAASITVEGQTLKIVNLTGHKLISGYPEGRRMWVNIRWYDSGGSLLREDGKYGVVATLDLDGDQTPETPVKSIIDLHDPNTKIYEAHYAMTQQWAQQLRTLGYPADMSLSYDRVSGAVNKTLGQLASQPAGSHYDTFHFVLNNYVSKDNRIPPYGMSYDASGIRNTLPVPASQYGDPGSGGRYRHWDRITLNPPQGAAYAAIDLLYQPTSWEYIQFLYLANNKQNAFLANEGEYLLDAWLNTNMAAPYVMASTEWARPPLVPGDTNGDDIVDGTDYANFVAQFGGPPAEDSADFNGDGRVDLLDFVILRLNFGTGADGPPIIVDSPKGLPEAVVETLTTWGADNKGDPVEVDAFRGGETVEITADVVGAGGIPLGGAQVFAEVIDTSGELVTSLQGFTSEKGQALLKWKTGRRQASGAYIVLVTAVIKSGYKFDADQGQPAVEFSIE